MPETTAPRVQMELNNRKNEVKAEAKMSSIAIEVRHTASCEDKLLC